MRFILGVILLIFLGAVGVFAVQNTQTVRLSFLNWRLDAPIAFLAIAIYFLGMLSGWNVIAFLRRTINRVTAEPRSR